MDGTVQVMRIIRNDDTSFAKFERKREIQLDAIAPFYVVGFSPTENSKLYIASNQGNLLIFNALTGIHTGTAFSAGPVIDISISKLDGIIAGLATTDLTTVLHIWDSNGGELKALILQATGYGLAFSPTSDYLAVSDKEGISVWAVVDCLE